MRSRAPFWLAKNRMPAADADPNRQGRPSSIPRLLCLTPCNSCPSALHLQDTQTRENGWRYRWRAGLYRKRRYPSSRGKVAKDAGQRIRQPLQEAGQRRLAGDDVEALPLWGVEGRGARGGGAAAPPRHRQGRAVGMRAGSASRAPASAFGHFPAANFASERSERAQRS